MNPTHQDEKKKILVSDNFIHVYSCDPRGWICATGILRILWKEDYQHYKWLMTYIMHNSTPSNINWRKRGRISSSWEQHETSAVQQSVVFKSHKGEVYFCDWRNKEFLRAECLNLTKTNVLFKIKSIIIHITDCTQNIND